ncbi:hypothetical protein [Micromonospora sp. NPDC000442]|uniref:hypothetical protein n=1 Tax=Micromonospora sp. NPDC000442 TaxID=3364217 RepID=UPI00369F8B26
MSSQPQQVPGGVEQLTGQVDREADPVWAVLVAQQHPGFPEPIAVLAMGKVWRKADVQAWIREHRPELAGE